MRDRCEIKRDKQIDNINIQIDTLQIDKAIESIEDIRLNCNNIKLIKDKAGNEEEKIKQKIWKAI